MELRGEQLGPGSVVGGYRIDELISRGGMGVVYRVTNVALNRICALKVLRPEFAADEQFRARFMREMRIAASLNNLNIVGIHHAGEHEGMLYFVMDYVTGTDLREILIKQGAMDPLRAVDLLEQLASALDAAHALGLVHRDVKPANVLLTVRDGAEHVYLTDFGLAKKSDTTSALTRKGQVVGTVDYMAPEQITGSHTDARTDIYALGCVFYEMLTGSVPYVRDESVATLYAHIHEPVPPLEGDVRETHPEFAGVLEKAIAKDPADRYASCGDFARDAMAALRGTRDVSPPTMVARGEAAPAEATQLAAEPTAAPAAEPTAAPAAEPTAAPAAEPTAAPAAEPTVLAPDEPPAAPTAAPEPAPTARPEPVPTPAPTPAPGETVLAPDEPPAAPTAAPEPVATAAAAAAAAPAPTATPPPPEAPPPPAPAPPAPAPPAPRRRYGLIALVVVVVIAAGAGAVIALSGGSSKPTGEPFTAAARAVPTNRVAGSGSASVLLHGRTVTVTVDSDGLLNGSPHALHIHAGGKGTCPPASAAHLHNGHLSISTTDGIKFYGPPEVALTSRGDVSPKSIIDFSRYPTTGNVRYTRSFTIPQGVADAIAAGNGVIVVHGIDYNGNGIYDDVLDRSDLSHNLPGEATAPALCGPLVSSGTTASVGSGRGSGPTYTASLRRYVAAAPPAPSAFWLFCHTRQNGGSVT